MKDRFILVEREGSHYIADGFSELLKDDLIQICEMGCLTQSRVLDEDPKKLGSGRWTIKTSVCPF